MLEYTSNATFYRQLIQEVIRVGWGVDMVELSNFVDEVARHYTYPLIEWSKIDYAEDYEHLTTESNIYLQSVLAGLE